MLRIVKLFGVGAALVVLALATWSREQGGYAQSCTVTLYPGDSIQEAILRANSGDVICLSAGTFLGNFGFPKSLTLRGAGMANTKIISSSNANSPVISVAPPKTSVTVTIANVTITGGNGSLPTGVGIGSLTATGINVTLQSVRISDNDGCGIVSGGGNWQISVQNSQIYVNNCGIYITSGRLSVNSTDIQGNYSDGLFAQYEARVAVSNSTIRGNEGWGVRVALRKCGWDQDEFRGSVSLTGNNISSNGKGDVCLP